MEQGPESLGDGPAVGECDDADWDGGVRATVDAPAGIAASGIDCVGVNPARQALCQAMVDQEGVFQAACPSVIEFCRAHSGEPWLAVLAAAEAHAWSLHPAAADSWRAGATGRGDGGGVASSSGLGGGAASRSSWSGSPRDSPRHPEPEGVHMHALVIGAPLWEGLQQLLARMEAERVRRSRQQQSALLIV